MISISCLESKLLNNNNWYGRFQLAPFQKGEGLTVANALRRTLLAEKRAFFITWVDFYNAEIPYSVLTGMRESIFDILLNLKQVIFTSDTILVNNSHFLKMASNNNFMVQKIKYNFEPNFNMVLPMTKKSGINKNLKLQNLKNKKVNRKTQNIFCQNQILGKIINSENETSSRTFRKSSHLKDPLLDTSNSKKMGDLTYIGYICAKGPATIYAKNIKLPKGLKCVDPDKYIVTLADDGLFYLRFALTTEIKTLPLTDASNMSITINQGLKLNNVRFKIFPKTLFKKEIQLCFNSQVDPFKSNSIRSKRKIQYGSYTELDDFKLWPVHCSKNLINKQRLVLTNDSIKQLNFQNTSIIANIQKTCLLNIQVKHYYYKCGRFDRFLFDLIKSFKPNLISNYKKSSLKSSPLKALLQAPVWARGGLEKTALFSVYQDKQKIFVEEEKKGETNKNIFGQAPPVVSLQAKRWGETQSSNSTILTYFQKIFERQRSNNYLLINCKPSNVKKLKDFQEKKHLIEKVLNISSLKTNVNSFKLKSESPNLHIFEGYLFKLRLSFHSKRSDGVEPKNKYLASSVKWQKILRSIKTRSIYDYLQKLNTNQGTQIYFLLIKPSPENKISLLSLQLVFGPLFNLLYNSPPQQALFSESKQRTKPFFLNSKTRVFEGEDKNESPVKVDLLNNALQTEPLSNTLTSQFLFRESKQESAERLYLNEFKYKHREKKPLISIGPRLTPLTEDPNPSKMNKDLNRLFLAYLRMDNEQIQNNLSVFKLYEPYIEKFLSICLLFQCSKNHILYFLKSSILQSNNSLELFNKNLVHKKNILRYSPFKLNSIDIEKFITKIKFLQQWLFINSKHKKSIKISLLGSTPNINIMELNDRRSLNKKTYRFPWLNSSILVGQVKLLELLNLNKDKTSKYDNHLREFFYSGSACRLTPLYLYLGWNPKNKWTNKWPVVKKIGFLFTPNKYRFLNSIQISTNLRAKPFILIQQVSYKPVWQNSYQFEQNTNKLSLWFNNINLGNPRQTLKNNSVVLKPIYLNVEQIIYILKQTTKFHKNQRVNPIFFTSLTRLKNNNRYPLNYSFIFSKISIFWYSSFYKPYLFNNMVSSHLDLCLFAKSKKQTHSYFINDKTQTLNKNTQKPLSCHVGILGNDFVFKNTFSYTTSKSQASPVVSLQSKRWGVTQNNLQLKYLCYLNTTSLCSIDQKSKLKNMSHEPYNLNICHSKISFNFRYRYPFKYTIFETFLPFLNFSRNLQTKEFSIDSPLNKHSPFVFTFCEYKKEMLVEERPKNYLKHGCLREKGKKVWDSSKNFDYFPCFKNQNFFFGFYPIASHILFPLEPRKPRVKRQAEPHLFFKKQRWAKSLISNQLFWPEKKKNKKAPPRNYKITNTQRKDTRPLNLKIISSRNFDYIQYNESFKIYTSLAYTCLKTYEPHLPKYHNFKRRNKKKFQDSAPKVMSLQFFESLIQDWAYFQVPPVVSLQVSLVPKETKCAKQWGGTQKNNKDWIFSTKNIKSYHEKFNAYPFLIMANQLPSILNSTYKWRTMNNLNFNDAFIIIPGTWFLNFQLDVLSNFKNLFYLFIPSLQKLFYMDYNFQNKNQAIFFGFHPIASHILFPWEPRKPEVKRQVEPDFFGQKKEMIKNKLNWLKITMTNNELTWFRSYPKKKTKNSVYELQVNRKKNYDEKLTYSYIKKLAMNFENIYYKNFLWNSQKITLRILNNAVLPLVVNRKYSISTFLPKKNYQATAFINMPKPMNISFSPKFSNFFVWGFKQKTRPYLNVFKTDSRSHRNSDNIVFKNKTINKKNWLDQLLLSHEFSKLYNCQKLPFYSIRHKTLGTTNFMCSKIYPTDRNENQTQKIFTPDFSTESPKRSIFENKFSNTNLSSFYDKMEILGSKPFSRKTQPLFNSLKQKKYLPNSINEWHAQEYENFFSESFSSLHSKWKPFFTGFLRHPQEKNTLSESSFIDFETRQKKLNENNENDLKIKSPLINNLWSSLFFCRYSSYAISTKSDLFFQNLISNDSWTLRNNKIEIPQTSIPFLSPQKINAAVFENIQNTSASKSYIKNLEEPFFNKMQSQYDQNNIDQFLNVKPYQKSYSKIIQKISKSQNYKSKNYLVPNYYYYWQKAVNRVILDRFKILKFDDKKKNISSNWYKNSLNNLSFLQYPKKNINYVHQNSISELKNQYSIRRLKNHEQYFGNPLRRHIGISQNGLNFCSITLLKLYQQFTNPKFKKANQQIKKSWKSIIWTVKANIYFCFRYPLFIQNCNLPWQKSKQVFCIPNHWLKRITVNLQPLYPLTCFTYLSKTENTNIVQNNNLLITYTQLSSSSNQTHQPLLQNKLLKNITSPVHMHIQNKGSYKMIGYFTIKESLNSIYKVNYIVESQSSESKSISELTFHFNQNPRFRKPQNSMEVSHSIKRFENIQHDSVNTDSLTVSNFLNGTYSFIPSRTIILNSFNELMNSQINRSEIENENEYIQIDIWTNGELSPRQALLNAFRKLFELFYNLSKYNCLKPIEI